MHTGFWWENMKERDCFEELVIGWTNIKMAVKQAGWVVVDQMYLSQTKDQWWAVLNVVMNLCSMEIGWLGSLVSQSLCLFVCLIVTNMKLVFAYSFQICCLMKKLSSVLICACVCSNTAAPV
jgi:hypothetical protein